MGSQSGHNLQRYFMKVPILAKDVPSQLMLQIRSF